MCTQHAMTDLKFGSCTSYAVKFVSVIEDLSRVGLRHLCDWGNIDCVHTILMTLYHMHHYYHAATFHIYMYLPIITLYLCCCSNH